MIKKLFLTFLFCLLLTTSVFGVGFDADTKLLIHLDGSDGSTSDYTAETGQTVSLEGTAQLDTAQKKFGTASLLLDGNSDYVTVPDSADWDFGTGNFTIDLWVRFNANPTGVIGSFFEQYINASNFTQFFVYNGNLRIQYYVGATSIIYVGVENPGFSADTWYHLAFVRYGTAQNNILIFIDGVSKSLTWYTNLAANANLDGLASILYIGWNQHYTGFFNGWFDEVRVSKGIARWTANFTPPVSEYTWRRIISIQ